MGPRRPFQARETLDAVTVPSGNSVLTYSQGCLSQPSCWFPRCSIRLCAGPAQFFSAGGSRSLPPLNCFLVLPTRCLPNLMLDFLPQPWRKDSSVVWVPCVVSQFRLSFHPLGHMLITRSQVLLHSVYLEFILIALSLPLVRYPPPFCLIIWVPSLFSVLVPLL